MGAPHHGNPTASITIQTSTFPPGFPWLCGKVKTKMLVRQYDNSPPGQGVEGRSPDFCRITTTPPWEHRSTCERFGISKGGGPGEVGKRPANTSSHRQGTIAFHATASKFYGNCNSFALVAGNDPGFFGHSHSAAMKSQGEQKEKSAPIMHQ